MDHIDTGSRIEQRKFGIVMAVAICVLALIRWWLKSAFPLYFFVGAAAFLVLGLTVPWALRPVFILWLKLAEALNWIMTRVLLTVAFYLMITPAAMLNRIFGSDPLKREWHPDAPTYWEDAEEQPAGLEPYKNQF